MRSEGDGVMRAHQGEVVKADTVFYHLLKNPPQNTTVFCHLLKKPPTKFKKQCPYSARLRKNVLCFFFFFWGGGGPEAIARFKLGFGCFLSCLGCVCITLAFASVFYIDQSQTQNYMFFPCQP